MRFVVVAEAYLLLSTKLSLDLIGDPQFLAEPQGHRHQVRAQTTGGGGEIAFEQPLELHERLFVEVNDIHLADRDTRFFQAIRDGERRKSMVLFLAREALFLRCSNDAAIRQQTCRRVVIVGRQPEHV